MKKVLVLTGPTASGKTALSILLAKHFNASIISGDSQQVYRGLDIGTAKIKPEEMEGIEHFGIDQVDADQNYSVKDFQEYARKKIDEIVEDGKLPMVVGGTGLYLKALLYDYRFDEEGEVQSFDHLTNEELETILKEKDPESLTKIHPNNRKRLLRAVQIASQGISKSEREADQNASPLYDFKLIVLERDKAILDERIHQRIEMLIQQGLLDEINRYFKDEKSWSYQSFQGIGYKEFKEYLLGQESLKDAKQKLFYKTRQFAKRQKTWFRHQFDAQWFNLDQDKVEELIQSIERWINT